MDNLINNIVSYLSYLNTKSGLTVSVHFKREFLHLLPKEVFLKLIDFNSHTNPYCQAVKNESHNKCVMEQKNIMLKNSDNPFEFKCFAGVLQYVFPIMKNKTAIGFVSVSGHRKSGSENNAVDFHLYKEYLSEKSIPKTVCDALIPPLVYMLENLFSNYENVNISDYNMIVQYLNEYHCNATLSDVCEYIGRSKSYVSHLFKKESKMTFRGYCNNLKLIDAHVLLLNTDKSITEIAFDTGFKDTSYFISLFRKKYGVSPFKYRKVAL